MPGICCAAPLEVRKLTDKLHNAFDSVTASRELKASTAQFLSAQRSRTRSKAPTLRMALAAACLLLVTALGVTAKAALTPVSYISIDINPSLELSLNRFDRVISATAYNRDAREALTEVNLKWLAYTEAIEVFTSQGMVQSCLDKDGTLVFTVAADSEEKQAAILTGVENCSSYADYDALSSLADVESLEEAHSCGLSFGKYAAYRELSGYDSSVTVEDCRHMSMSEIRRQISHHESSGSHTGTSSSGHNSHGSGNGHHGSEH